MNTLAISLIIAATLLSLTLVIIGYKVSSNLILFSEIIKEYINRERDNGRDTSREKLPVSPGEYQAQSDMEPKTLQNVETGPQPEDFSNIVSKVPRTAVSFGEDVED